MELAVICQRYEKFRFQIENKIKSQKLLLAESCYFNKFWGFYHKLLFIVNSSKSKFIEHSRHSGKVLYWYSIDVCSILAFDIFSERIWLKRDSTQVQKCAISVFNSRSQVQKILCYRKFSY